MSLALLSVLLSAFTNLYIAVVLSRRWYLSDDVAELLMIITTVVVAGVSGALTKTVATEFGQWFGVACAVGVVPAVCFLWIFTITTMACARRVVDLCLGKSN